jgi:PmbA protein
MNTEFSKIVPGICERIRNSARIEKVDGTEQVLFMPHALPVFIAGFKAALNGKTLQKGASPLKGRAGETIIDRRLRFVDDPTLAFMSGSYSDDGEGVPGSVHTLVEEGVLKGFIFDLQTAGLMKTRSTGNGLRGYSSAPSPGFSNFVVSAGERPMAEIQKSMKNGLVIYSVLGGGQSNMLAGDFSLNLHLAYKVRNGEITGRVKDSMVSGNIYRVFNQVAEISSDTRSEGSSVMPAVLFDGMSITG